MPWVECYVRASDPDACPLSGNGVAMIENHYGHLVRGDAEEALASIAI